MANVAFLAQLGFAHAFSWERGDSYVTQVPFSPGDIILSLRIQVVAQGLPVGILRESAATPQFR